MKRYNLHIPPEWIEEIRKITNQLINQKNTSYSWRKPTVADLIRDAISTRFNLSNTGLRYGLSDLPEDITKLMKAKKKGKKS